MTFRPRGVVMGHPTLNANVRHAALALAESGNLREFITGLDTTHWPKTRRTALATEIARRTLPEPVHVLTRTKAIPELARIAATRLPARINPFDLHLGRLSIQARFEAIDAALAREVRDPEATGVYAYEDGAARVFETAAAMGKGRVYDLPTGYWRTGRRLFLEEAQRRPDWAGTLKGLRDPEWKLERKDAELAGASHIVVASSFTASTLNDFPGRLAPVTILPYGAPTGGSPRRVDPSHPIRVIFVGSVGQHKGIADLVDALSLADVPIALTVLGRPVGASRARDQALDAARWVRSAPHTAVLREIAKHDVLVLPSLFEGFGLVLSEALSQGTPIVATDHTAAPDLIAGVSDAGWVVPIRSPESIAAALSGLADPVFREHTREQALVAAQLHSWGAYRAGVVSTVNACAI